MRDLLNRLKSVEKSLQGKESYKTNIYLKDGSNVVMDCFSALEYLYENSDNVVSADMVDEKYKNSTMKAVFQAFIG